MLRLGIGVNARFGTAHVRLFILIHRLTCVPKCRKAGRLASAKQMMQNSANARRLGGWLSSTVCQFSSRAARHIVMRDVRTSRVWIRRVCNAGTRVQAIPTLHHAVVLCDVICRFFVDACGSGQVSRDLHRRVKIIIGDSFIKDGNLVAAFIRIEVLEDSAGQPFLQAVSRKLFRFLDVIGVPHMSALLALVHCRHGWIRHSCSAVLALRTLRLVIGFRKAHDFNIAAVADQDRMFRAGNYDAIGSFKNKFRPVVPLRERRPTSFQPQNQRCITAFLNATRAFF